MTQPIQNMITEEMLEQECIEWFQNMGWDYICGYELTPDSNHFQRRKDYTEVILTKYLKEALERINPHIPQDTLTEAINKLTCLESLNLIENNKQFHQYLTEGIPVESKDKDETRCDFVKIIDFDNIENNYFLIVNQMTILGPDQKKRRPDLIALINGLPIAVIELKNLTEEQTHIWKAYQQIKTYKEEIPDLFTYNVACIISDGIHARIGSITAEKERYAYWRTLKTERDKPHFDFELETMTKGFFDKELLLDYIRYFIIFEFDNDSHRIIKKIASYHQFHAVREAINSTIAATCDIKDGKCGVVWHTQGSGKSLSMCCYAAKLMQHEKMNNPTLVIVTDRKNLDDQLYNAFDKASDLLREKPKQADSREELRTLLNRPSGGIIFTTIQKFSLIDNEQQFPKLSDRSNVVVISDEAHRSQYGFKGHVQKYHGKITYGYAKHLRDALPHAGFIGFTGTPISKQDRDTREVFGDYVSIYDIEQSVKDQATVPIYYESRLVNLHLTEDAENIDTEVDEIMESQNTSDSYINEQKRKWASLEKLVTAKSRMKQMAQDIVQHWENRLHAIDGKALIVCMSRRACVQLYNELIALKLEWMGSKDKNGKPSIDDGVVRIVMTGHASDEKSLRVHDYGREGRKNLETRFKRPDDILKIVIVRDMWLTGFDAPVLHTMYIDKPMCGANLMQAIARVNRVFKDKPGGLVVDYLGIATELKEALQTYTQSQGKGQPTIDVYETLSLLKEKLNIVRDMLKGVDYLDYKNPKRIFSLMRDACDYILGQTNGQKKFCDIISEITKANALCGTMPEALVYRDEIAFFQAIRVALIKKDNVKNSDSQMQDALRQLISKAIVSDKVIDIFQIAGLKSPDISILSDQFLEEVQSIKQKNLAVELLARLLDQEIKSKTAKNIVQAKKYSEMLTEALKKYHNRAIETAQVIEELITMAKDFKKVQGREEQLGLNEDELAFYDALANNESAVRELKDETLRVMAHKLTRSLKGSVTIDWIKRESVRAKLRLKVKRLLKKYKYPPDKREDAIDLVIQQAEKLSEDWSQTD